MAIISVEGELLEVVKVVEYARGPDGTCAFCAGDPCNEDNEDNDGNMMVTSIYRFYEKNKWASTCPVCNGRPT